MITLIGGGAAAVVFLGYVGHKSWQAFHRAVGISPKKMVYIEPAQLPPPTMIQLQLTQEQLQNLPSMIIEQLIRIDHKADIYQTWKSDLVQSGQTPATNEEEFIVSKLLSTRLPDMIDSFQRIARHEKHLANAEQGIQTNAKTTQKVATTHSINHNEAAALLVNLLHKIETKLDGLLQNYTNASLQDMQVMDRYLEDR